MIACTFSENSPRTITAVAILNKHKNSSLPPNTTEARGSDIANIGKLAGNNSVEKQLTENSPAENSSHVEKIISPKLVPTL